MREYVEGLDDIGNTTLGELKAIVDKLVQERGDDKKISFDAGYNNISVYYNETI